MRLRLMILPICIFLAPSAAFAQGDRASIAGIVQDESGAVLPGVTVEAASPALIEQTRTAVTDSSGRYAIVDLRPGTYSVTFTLTGFRTMRREGILLEGAFAAQVNASLGVGSLEETITVTGASPVVDLQSTRNQFVANKAILEALPVARTLNGGMSLVPGVNSSNNAAGSSPGQIISELYINTATVHGSVTADQHTYVDGMNVAQMLLGAGGQIAANPPNDLGFAEVTYDVGAQSAEVPNAGVRSDVIPKEGGNTFAGTYRAFGANHQFQGENLTPKLSAFIKNPSRANFNWESNIAAGGPIKQNKLWYFGAFKVTQAVIFMTDQFYPDGRRVDNGGHVNPNMTLRLTYQMTPKTKVRVSGNNGTVITERWDVTGQTAPEAGLWLATPLNYSGIAKMTSVRTNRLMVEAAQSLASTTYQYHYQPEVKPFDLARREATTGKTSGAYTGPTNYFDTIWHSTANLNYVTGTHAVKVGASLEHGWQKQDYYNNGDVQQVTVIGGTASSVSVRNTPVTRRENVNAISSTASVLSHGSDPITVPSIWYWFSFVLEPREVAVVPVPMLVVWLTPGAELIRSKYENRRTGAFSTHSLL
jgi:carboxypeptidase family protein